MFRKYYKDANNDIKPDEELINKVIANAHKKQPPLKRKNRYKYAASVAAAAVVVSTALITVPYWQETVSKDTGVIVEIKQTPTPDFAAFSSETADSQAFPTQNPQTDASAFPPDNSNSESKTQSESGLRGNTSKTSNADYGNSPFSNNIPKSESENIAAQNTESAASDGESASVVSSESTADAADNSESSYASDGDFSVETESFTDAAAESRGAAVQSADNAQSADTAQTADSDNEPSLSESAADIEPSSAVTSAGGASSPSSSAGGAVSSSSSVDAALSVYIPAPSGFYAAGSSYGSAVFASDSGASVTVNYSYSGGTDSAPVYSELNGSTSVNFTSDGIAYSIYSSDAPMTALEEIVNSILN